MVVSVVPPGFGEPVEVLTHVSHTLKAWNVETISTQTSGVGLVGHTEVPGGVSLPAATHLVATAGEPSIPLGQNTLHPQEERALNLILWERREGSRQRQAQLWVPANTRRKSQADSHGPRHHGKHVPALPCTK